MNLKGRYKDYLPRYCLMSLTCLFSQPKFDGSLQLLYRHFSIYAVNMGTHEKTAESENSINRGYLEVLKRRKIG